MTLLQHDTAITDTSVRYLYNAMVYEFGEIMFLGLRKNEEVSAFKLVVFCVLGNKNWHNIKTINVLLPKQSIHAS